MRISKFKNLPLFPKSQKEKQPIAKFPLNEPRLFFSYCTLANLHRFKEHAVLIPQ